MNWTEYVRGSRCISTSNIPNISIYSTNSSNDYRKRLLVKQITCDNEEEAMRAENKAEIAQNHPHSHICSSLGWKRENSSSGAFYVYVFYPNISYSLQSDIDERVREQVPYPEFLLQKLLEQCVETFAYLQERGIAHRDIKPENLLLLRPEDSQQVQVKLYDFSLAKHADQPGPVLNTFFNSKPFSAPEVRRLSATPSEPQIYDPFKSDVYSLGVVLLNLTLLKVPDELTNLRNLSKALEWIISGLRNYSVSWQSVLRLMLQVDEKDRPDFLALRSYLASGNEEVLPTRSDRALPDPLLLAAKCGLLQVRVSPQQVDEVPCMVSIKAGDVDLTHRPYGVDIVCVIDQSGSMMDFYTLQCVKFALSGLVKRLDYYDRFALVGFSDFAVLKCPLTCCSSTGQAKALAAIEQVEALDLTNLSAGLELAFELLEQRKYRNSLASIWLFTDGHCTIGENLESCALPASLPLTVNCFGWGQVHSLRDLAKKGSGSFYHIKHVGLLGEAFAQALDSLVTTVARDVVVKFDLLSGSVPCTITNTFSNQDNEEREFSFPYVTANQQKNLLFLLKPKQQHLHSPVRQNTIQVTLTYTDCEGATVTLAVPVLIHFVQIGPAAAQTVDIYKKWYCVLGADCLDKARVRADRGDFLGANDALALGIETLKAGGYDFYPEVKAVLQDLQTAREVAASQSSWEQGGSEQFERMAERHCDEVDAWERTQAQLLS